MDNVMVTFYIVVVAELVSLCRINSKYVVKYLLYRNTEKK